jgi:hypothetical protein
MRNGSRRRLREGCLPPQFFALINRSCSSCVAIFSERHVARRCCRRSFKAVLCQRGSEWRSTPHALGEGGPGIAMHHFAAARAASHPGHRILGRVRSPIHLSNSTRFSVSAARFLRPGFETLASRIPMKGWRSAESRTGARTPVGLHVTRQARRLRGALRPITRDARLSALSPWRFLARVPRLPHRTCVRIGCELLASGS